MRRKTAKVGCLLTNGPVPPHGIYRSDRSVCILVRHIASYSVLQYAYALRMWLTFRW
jgi:hypothetical protein